MSSSSTDRSTSSDRFRPDNPNGSYSSDSLILQAFGTRGRGMK